MPIRATAYVPAPVRRGLRRLLRRGPRNFARRDADTVNQDVDQALHAANAVIETITSFGLDFHGLRVLELGPGHHFGPQLLLASRGAQVTLADRFLAPWEASYHPTFYRTLRARWDGPAEALERVIAAEDYHNVLTLLAEPAEHLASVPDSSIDLAWSIAVLEHVFDLPAVCRELARVTRLGGVNIHQVDFRWHRAGFTRPLDFLLHDDARFQRDFAAEHGEGGNRWRASEVAAMFQEAGFDIVRLWPTLEADPELLTRFLPRLRRARSPYRSWPEEDLAVLGAGYELKRTDNAAARDRAAAALAAQRRRKSEALARTGRRFGRR